VQQFAIALLLALVGLNAPLANNANDRIARVQLPAHSQGRCRPITVDRLSDIAPPSTRARSLARVGVACNVSAPQKWGQGGSEFSRTSFPR
jgi:hypothetical protein